MTQTEKVLAVLLIVSILISIGAIYYANVAVSKIGAVSGDLGTLSDALSDDLETLSTSIAGLSGVVQEIADIVGAPTYTCDICGATFATAEALEAHIDALHPPVQPVAGGVLRIGVVQEPTGLWPSGTVVQPSVVRTATFEKLFEVSHEGELIPWLCESYEVSEDGLEYTFHIRQNVLFHHGRELNATDVYWELGAYAGIIPKEDLPWPGSQRFWGAMELMGQSVVKEMEVVDKYTLKVTLNFPHAGFVSHYLSTFWYHIGPIDEMFRLGEDFHLNPSGTGPWKLKEWKSGEHIIYDKWELYWGQEPLLDKLIVKIIPDHATRLAALLTGEIDIAEGLEYEQFVILEGDPRFKTTWNPLENDFTVVLNQREARGWPMTDPRFRKAIYHAVDWEALVNAIFPDGEALAYQSYFKTAFGGELYDPTIEDRIPDYDPAEAESIINDLKAIKDFDHPIQIVAPPVLSRDKVGEFIGLALLDVGVPVDVRILAPPDWIGVVKGQALDPYSVEQPGWDITMLASMPVNRDPSACVAGMYSMSAQIPVDKSNFGGWNSSEVDQLLYDGATSLDRDDRIATYRQIEELYWDNIPYIRYANPGMRYVWRAYVQDLESLFEWEFLARLCTPTMIPEITANNVWLKED